MGQLMQADKSSPGLIEHRIDNDKPLRESGRFPGAIVAENIRVVVADREFYSFSFRDPIYIVKCVWVVIELRERALHPVYQYLHGN